MANLEHLAILKQGVEQWNKWRRESPSVRPYLDGADLSLADLEGANLRDAYLDQAKLSKAKLWTADLKEADLSNADLSVANLGKADLLNANLERANLSAAVLCEANLSWVNFHGAKLDGADLSGANLSGANLSNTGLRAANLRGALLRWSIFSNTDLHLAEFNWATIGGVHFSSLNLEAANGLETIDHWFPSTVGIDTIYKSHGKIPEVFLRGCGLSDWEIEAAKLYDPALTASQAMDVVYRVIHLRNSQPFQYYSCFISYSTKDQEFADRLYADLQAQGVRCWFAPHDIKGGRKIHEQIDEAIRLHDKLLLILSEHSMASDWVQTEIAKARKREAQEKRQMLFPVALVPYDPAIRDWECFDADRGKDSAREAREYYIPDFSNWMYHDSYQTAFQRLVKDLKS